MNRGVVQQMMGGGGNPNNSNWWNTIMRPPYSSSVTPPSSSALPFPPYCHHDNQLLPQSWCEEEEEDKKLESRWEEEMLISSPILNSGYVYGHGSSAATWSHQILPSSSPKSSSSTSSSCLTGFTANMLDFSNNSNTTDASRPPPPDPSSECNSSSTGTGGAFKKARVQRCTTQSSTFKVRKEKLGDRITALHQLVSPFGKTDTASVLLEAIGYIRFLQSQIESLSLPYLGSTGTGNTRHQQQQPLRNTTANIQGENNCLFPEDPGQLLNESRLKRKAANEEEYSEEEGKKVDLKSRGLCLVPVSCTLQVGSDSGADYWAPAAFAGGFR